MSNSLVSVEDSRAFLQSLIDSQKLPSHVKSVEEAFTIAQMGKELGFPVMQSFHYIIPIQGKLSLSAKAVNALLRRGGWQIKTVEDGVYVYADESTSIIKRPNEKPVDIRTTLTFIRGKEEETCSFSWKDAEGMGLTKKDNWVKMPKFMLWARCLSTGANRVGADLLLGLYSAEELYDHMDSSHISVTRDEEGEIVEVITHDDNVKEDKS